MPTIDISLKDLNSLVKKELTQKRLEEEAALLVKGEIDKVEGDKITITCADSNRPDLWSTEGIARALRPYYTEEKWLQKYTVLPSNVYLHVDRTVDDIRPFIAAAVLENVAITENLLLQMIQLQEKVCMTFGRKRKTVAIGLYDFDKMTPPLTYKAVKPTECSFIPLDFKKEMTLKDILKTHHKGIEYGHLLEGLDKYPIIVDSKGVIASMPPIINSQATGKVSEDTKNLFVEVTGTSREEVHVALTIMVAALADRGGTIKSVTIDYGEKKFITPNFTPKRIKVKFTDIERIAGMKLSLKELKKYLGRYGYDVKKAKDGLELEYATWRQDILHPIDVIEDLLISYGYNYIEPLVPAIATVGSVDELEAFCEPIRNVLVGFGGQELLNFTLTNKETLFTKMNLQEFPLVEIANPVSLKWTHIRNWVLPSVLEFLEKNTMQEYPQQVYELGDAVVIDEKAETRTKTIKRLAWVLAEKDANFTKAKQILDYVLTGLGLSYEILDTEHNSFISGRCGRVVVNGIEVAYIGEMHPQVLTNFKMGFPVCAFEINISEIFKLKQKK